MYRKYKLRDGSILNAWITSFGDVELMNKHDNIFRIYRYDKNEKNPYFYYNKEKVYVNDFVYDTIDTMIEKIENVKLSKDVLNHYDILSTFIKEKDKIGIEMEVPKFDIIVPDIGLGIKSSMSESIKTIMIPCEDRYKSSQWYYKIEFEPLDENLRILVGRQVFYFHDLVSMILSGQYNLIKI